MANLTKLVKMLKLDHSTEFDGRYVLVLAEVPVDTWSLWRRLDGTYCHGYFTHWHVFTLSLSFEYLAYATDAQVLKKLQRFRRYAKRQGRVIRERERLSRGR